MLLLVQPLLLLLVLLLPTTGTVLPLPRAHQHQRFELPLRGAAPGGAPSPQRLLLVAEAGHGVARSARSLCAQVGTAFELEGHLTPAQCAASVARSLRAARGLAAQHEPAVAAGVGALESYLGEEGHAEEDWAGSSGTWLHPYKARFLRSLVARAVAAAAAAAAASAGDSAGQQPPAEAPEVNVCSVGFGVGHSALIALTAADAGVRVFSFDRATGRAAVPAQDFLDVRFPERHMLFLGDPPAALARFVMAFPFTKCAVLLVEPNALQPLLGNATAAALRGLAPLAAADHALVLLSPLALPPPPLPQSAQAATRRRAAEAAAAAAAGNVSAAAAAPPGEAWAQAEAAGWLRWEGTLLAAPEAPEGDRVLYGAFAVGAEEAMAGARLPIEQ